MKKYTRKPIILLVLMLAIPYLLVGCGSKATDMEAMNGGAISESFDGSGDLFDYEAPEKGESSSESSSVSTNRKIIERISLRVETKEFDLLLNKLEEELAKLGGYMESSSVSGNSYRYEGNRYANLTVRVPSDKTSGFTTFVSENSTITNKEVSTEDVTLSYVDMESRVSALETEKAALESLLAKAETVDDIIIIRNQLTDVIYEIESYESRLRAYDNLIEYTTISIYISEVERVTVVEEENIWQEIAGNLKENFEDVGHDLVRAFVFVVSNLPYFMVWAVIISIVIFVVKKVIKKPKNPIRIKPKFLKKEKTDE